MWHKYYTVVASLSLVVLSALGQTIDTPSSTQTKEKGRTAMFECHVLRIESTDQKVVWTFVDHNVTIFVGQEQQANLYNNKYSIIKPQGTYTGTYWNLQITDVGASDVGTYRCYVKGSKPVAKVDHHLEVKNATVVVPPEDLDVTPCCIGHRVEECAQPLCKTATPLPELLPIFAQFANNTCDANNLIKVLQCAQDGRNHLGCCVRTGMPDHCTNLCNGYGQDDGTDYTACIGYAQSIIRCFKEGHANMPSRPTSVSAVAKENTILVSWKPPQENADLVTKYKVQYRLKGSGKDYVFDEVDAFKTFTTLKQQLAINQIYEIRVIAVGDNGASQPSYIVDIATRAPVPGGTNTELIKSCCKSQNVSEGCIDYCDDNIIHQGLPHDSLLKCYSEISTIYKCLMNHGNHTPCCQRLNVPDNCLELCQGEFIVTWNLTTCLSYTPLISACVDEGSILLPSPPKNTRIVPGSVTPRHATIKWDLSDNYNGTNDKFSVAWKADKTRRWNSVTLSYGTTFTLYALRPATIYDVVVTTVNQYGSSLPELTLVFVTEGDGVELKPYNETECCMRKGVVDECLDICVHNKRLASEIVEKALKCFNHITPMLQCAADGRDHTACCVREGISPGCRSLCQMDHNSQATIEFIQCIEYKDKLSRCFDEGKTVLPLPPLEFSVQRQDVTSITLDWHRPGGPKIDKFRVEFSSNGIIFNIAEPTIDTFQTVEGLENNSPYYFYVRSLNSAGQSLQSSLIETRTLALPSGENTTDWNQLWQNRTDCCKSQLNDTSCQDSCINGNINEPSCASDIDKMLTCSADGRDHTRCCQNLPDFPMPCLPLCAGLTIERTVMAALCVKAYEEILTCFTVGRGLLPTFPGHVRVTDTTDTSITLSWETPESNCDNSTVQCGFVAMALQSEIDEKNTNEWEYGYTNSTTLSHKFRDLKPGKMYRLTVRARNRFGQSLNSPYIYQETDPDALRNIAITQHPSGLIKSGASVQLGCAGYGAAISAISWVKNEVLISPNGTLNLANVGEADADKYTCNVEFFDGQNLTSTWQLNVNYAPVAVSHDVTKNVLPGIHQDATVVCKFRGFPSSISWQFNDDSLLQGSAKYDIRLSPNVKTGLTSSNLTIYDVTTKDYGTYTCNATNEYGSKTISTDFLYIHTTPTLPPSRPNNSTFIEDCCRSEGVPEMCLLDICTYSVDIHKVVTQEKYFHCLSYFNTYLNCGSDRKNHTKCCQDKSVQDTCLPFCAGQLPDGDSNVLWKCYNQAETIINCAVMGIQHIPTAPQNVGAKVVDDSIVVTWDIPAKNAEKVDKYDVFFLSPSTPEDHESAGKKSTQLTLPAEKIKKELYTIWVLAENHYGSSQKSNVVNVSVTVLTAPAPRNLKFTILDKDTVNLSWDKSKTRHRVLGYNVYFKKSTEKEYKKQKVLASTGTQLAVSQASKYVIYVRAFTADGEGSPSESVNVDTTKGGKPTSPEKHQTSASEAQTGMIVGVVLGVVFIVAVAVVGIFLFRRFGFQYFKKGSSETREAVSFENPQYSTSRVTGLPGESTGDNNPFGYDHLQEDIDHDPGYLTLQPGFMTDENNSKT